MDTIGFLYAPSLQEELSVIANTAGKKPKVTRKAGKMRMGI